MEKSKETILSRIKKSKPESTPLPEIPDFAIPSSDLSLLFAQTLEKVGGRVVHGLSREEVGSAIRKAFPEARHCWSDTPDVLESNVSLHQGPHQLENLDLAVVQGEIGVAENGAVWVTEAALPQRVLAFITLDLILLLDKNQIVWNMHQAYQKIGHSLPGFGIFISGPSKTADIEQSLVIGAQGPTSLTVFLL